MTVENLAEFLCRYEQERSMTANVFRYAAKASSVQACPGTLGMDFESIMGAPDAEKAAVFMAQETRAEMVRGLMAGADVDDAAMEKAFGFTMTQLRTCMAERDPVRGPIPRRLCVLCFDDAYKTQYTVAMPILQELGFGATFFIAELQKTPHGATFEDKNVFMTWEQIAQLEKAGFELGNHSLHHVWGAQNMGRDFNIEQIRGMEEEFARHGLQKPVTYAYPSGISTPELVACARECGYRWGRGNQEKDGNGIRGMTYYDPKVDSPLALCNFGDPDFYSEALLKKRIEDTPEGCIFGMTYHDVGDDHWPGPISFRRQMEILKELDMQVIAVRDLDRYIDAEKAWHYTLGGV